VIRLGLDGQVLSSTVVPSLPYVGIWLVSAGGAMWTTSGSQLIRLDGSSAFQSFSLPIPDAFWLVSGGDFLWVANDGPTFSDPTTILRVSTAGVPVATYLSSATTIYGATSDREGNLWLSEQFTSRIVRVTPGGESSVVVPALEDEGLSCLGREGPEPIAVFEDGRFAIGKWSYDYNIPPPGRACAPSFVYIVDPAHLAEVPLSPAALAAMAFVLVTVALLRLGLRE
jgi:hypothetical protein